MLLSCPANMPRPDIDPLYRGDGKAGIRSPFIGEPYKDSVPPSDLLLFSARNDALRAHDIFLQRPPVRREYAYIRAGNAMPIARGFIATGIDATDVLAGIDSDIAQSEVYRQDQLLRGRNILTLQQGDIDKALTTAERIAEISHSFIAATAFHDIARSVDDRGVKRHALDRAEALAEKQGDSHMLGLLAQTEHAIGFGKADELLVKASGFIQKRDGDVSYWYGPLVEAYAGVGQFDTALALVPRIQEELHGGKQTQRQRDALQEIAYKQVAAGQLDQAMQTAELTNSAKVKMSITVEAAKAQAKSEGARSTNTLDRVLARVTRYGKSISPETYTFPTGNYHGVVISDFYTSLGEANAAAGRNPEPLFAAAKEQLTRLPLDAFSDKADGLLNIAQAQNRVGINALPELQQSLEMADQVHPEDFSGIVGRLLVYEDIGKAAIDMGHFDFTDQLLDRYDKLDPEDTFGEDTIELLSLRAVEKAKKAKQLQKAV